MHTYRHFKPESTISSLDTALALYGCRHYEWIREPRHDMNCLLMWGPRALVICFRGTQSMANVRADAKVGAGQGLLGGCLLSLRAWRACSSAARAEGRPGC